MNSKMATWKRHVTLKSSDGCSEHYVPTPWLGGPPFHIELRTLHVDRIRLDQELQQMATNPGSQWCATRWSTWHEMERRVFAVETAGGARFSSPWFIDASGFAACLLAREFNLPAIHFGPAKVAMWTYFPVTESIEGTTLYMEPMRKEYLEWIWEIPISPKVVSVGYVTTGAATKAKRELGSSVEDIFRQQLMKFPRFEQLLQAAPLEAPNVTSFRCRAYTRVAGTNWLIAGEAASMVDPITANGVTAALRHAKEASATDLEVSQTGRAAAASAYLLQQPCFADGKVF